VEGRPVATDFGRRLDECRQQTGGILEKIIKKISKKYYLSTRVSPLLQEESISYKI
jgi:hypothetical protein